MPRSQARLRCVTGVLWLAALPWCAGTATAQQPSGPAVPVPTPSALPLRTADAAVTNRAALSTDVVYQIITDRFADGDPSNNPTGSLHDPTRRDLRRYHGGDWQGVIDRIEDGYLTKLGITALWLSPPVENITTLLPDFGGSAAYHGYWARDFSRPNAFFGDDATFRRLVDTAHRHGMKVLIDFAPNHTSPTRNGSPSYGEDGVLRDDGRTLANASNDPQGLFHGYGDTTFSSLEDGVYRNLLGLADLNHMHPTVDGLLRRRMHEWLDRGIDGIRIDAVKHMSAGWQRTLTDDLQRHRSSFLFGEWFLSPGEISPASHALANDGGMSLLDFRFAHAVRQSLRDGSRDMREIVTMLNGTAADYDEVVDQVTFIDNHDIDRFHFSGADPRRLEQALVLSLTSRGVPVIYYGTEQYLTGNGDPGNRRFMPSYDRSTTAYALISRLAPLRKRNAALAYGGTRVLLGTPEALVFERQFGGDVALVAINRSSQSSASVPRIGTALPAGLHGDRLRGLLAGATIQVDSSGSLLPFQLAPRSAAVWTTRSRTPATTVAIGNVGPLFGMPGATVTIDGRGFGERPGTVQFGTTPAPVLAWRNTQVRVRVPVRAPGRVTVAVQPAGSATPGSRYDNFDVRAAPQVPVRFVVDGAQTIFGENIYLVGNVPELGQWDTNRAVGPMFNQVVHAYPTWYFDVSVPAGTRLEFKFIKRFGGQVVWESGPNRSFTTPASGPSQVRRSWRN